MMNNTITPHATMTISAELHNIIEHALKKRIASSISLFIGFSAQDGQNDITIHTGYTEKITETKTSELTIYDLASLTKILGTTVAIANAMNEQIIDLEEIPFVAWPHSSIKTLLAHTAGLPAHKRFYNDLPLNTLLFTKNRKLITKELFALPSKKTCERVYSDLGFIALGLLLEERLNKPLFDIFSDSWRALLIEPKFIWFPSQNPDSLCRNVLVAETFSYERNMPLRAQVHDGNCYFMGGLAGHAGLFGNLDSVKIFGQCLLLLVQNPQSNLQKIIADFTKQGLGFDKPTADGSNKCLSPHAFGHFGYTGTSLWVDPALGPQGAIIALLTNRINESAEPEGIFWLRSAVNEAVSNSLRGVD